jgi:hypothetical protein
VSAVAGLTGGCLCGAVRYRLDAAPFDAGYCHCTLCRRSSGAPVLAFATVPRALFMVTSGEPRRRRSSSFGERWFCRDCGTQLAMLVDHQPETIDFTIASLDTPELVRPSFHLFFSEHIRWFNPSDTFPRHERLRPDTRGLGQTGDCRHHMG